MTQPAWDSFSTTSPISASRDLTFVDGLLSGYLLDGSWFSNQLTFGSDWRGSVTINNVTAPSVPEPGTLGLLGISLLGMMFTRRGSARREISSRLPGTP